MHDTAVYIECYHCGSITETCSNCIDGSGTVMLLECGHIVLTGAGVHLNCAEFKLVA